MGLLSTVSMHFEGDVDGFHDWRLQTKIMFMIMFPQYVAADSPEPPANSGTFVAMPATVESPGWQEHFMSIAFQLSRYPQHSYFQVRGSLKGGPLEGPLWILCLRQSK